jgi:putative inorganic carbon (hco3(-)) transporter
VSTYGGAEPVPTRRLIPAGILGFATIAAVLVAVADASGKKTTFEVAAGVVILAAVAYLVFQTSPTWTILAALVLSPIAGHWDAMGLPGALSPQRFLLLAAIVAIALRAPAIRNRPELPMKSVHWALVLASAYVVCSTIAAGNITNKDDIFRLLEAYGIILFALFAVAPVAFHTVRQRDALMLLFVVLGAYLGLTALFETIHLNVLVFPRYILDKHVGIHFGRARGPFAEAVTNGTALYACAVISVMAMRRWYSVGARVFAGVVVVLCGTGMLFTLQRSVWLGCIVASLFACLLHPMLRRHVVTLLVAGAVIAGIGYVVVPHDKLHSRANDQGTIWDRDNLNRAAINMIEDRPLLGFGWGTFQTASVKGLYYHQADTYPLTAVGFAIHNEYLSNGTELGLVGLTLWLVAMFMGAAAALSAPVRSPDIRTWKAVFLAYGIFYFVVSSFVPTQYFPNLVYWLLAGVCCAGWITPAARARPAPERA